MNQIFGKITRDTQIIDLVLHLDRSGRKIKLGSLNKSTATFRTVERSWRNVFNMFNGLGVNEELLCKLDFNYLEIPFNNEILRTTKTHFLDKAIPSPYISDKVDKQLILPLNEFYIPEEHEEGKEDQQFSMFGG